MAHAMTARVGLESRRPRPRFLASLAKQAMIAEAELTPKPGLVDRRGPGAHSDLSLELMMRSAEAIEPFLARMADASSRSPLGEPLRAELAAIGRDAERAMYAATGGTNTHKGAIWILGLLVSAANRRSEREPVEIARVAGTIARIPHRAGPSIVSHGEVVQSRYGVSGARGEACADFPHVVAIGVPALRKARRAGKPECVSRLSALLAIMARLDDTCVLYRAGLEGLQIVQAGARAVLASGGPGTEDGDDSLKALDQELQAKHISPGGSADLLAATLFLDCLVSGKSELEMDQGLTRETHGKD